MATSIVADLFGTSQPVALVTGSGAERVGNVVARHLVSLGFAVAIHYRTSRQDAELTVGELESSGGRAVAYQADLTVTADVEQLTAEVIEEFGRLDVLVNSAAIWEPQPLEGTSADDVRRHWEINSLSSFLLGQQAGLHMVSQPTGGVIVNVGDWATVRPYLNYAAYFASKGGIATLTRTLAVELAARNPRVRVNAVLPGPVMVPDDIVGRDRQAIVDGTLVKREGRPQHVAHAVQFLVENDFVTGACIPVDGGRRLA